jgi:signal transduction histidine kinase
MAGTSTIRQRLRLSNVLMVVVPLATCLVVAAVCLAVMWSELRGGAGVGLDDPMDFTGAAEVAEELVEHVLEGADASSALPDDLTARLDDVADSLAGSSMSIEVAGASGEVAYSSSGASAQDDALLAAAASVLGSEPASVSSGERCVRVSRDGDWTIAVFGTYRELTGDAMKRMVAISVVVVLMAAAVSLALMDRLCARMVYDRVMGPLETLRDGVRRISEGDLSYRISYDRPDEFAPICAAFNDMAARLEESDERERRDQRSHRELIAGISHDLRSPLTSIQGYVEGLIDGVASTPERQRSYLLTVRRKAQELERLVSELFLFSKLDLQDYPCYLREVELGAVVRSQVEEARGQLAERGLGVRAGEFRPCRARVDQTLLARCVWNVMDNAAKYDEGGTLTVSVAPVGGEAVVSLSDDGPGVDPETLGRLFDVFYRADPARRHPESGSGLGLAIVARAMGRMGGVARARAPEGGGLCVELAFPLVEDCGGAPGDAAEGA